MVQTNDTSTPISNTQPEKDDTPAPAPAPAVAPSDMVQSLLTSKQYNVLKWIVIIVLPAIITVYSTFSNIWGWPYGDQIAASLSAVTLFLGVVIGVSTNSYNKSSAGPSGTLVVDNTGSSAQTYIAFEQDPKTLADGNQITFNVKHVN